MKLHVLLTGLVSIFICSLQAQSYWTSITDPTIVQEIALQAEQALPTDFQVYTLNELPLRQALSKARTITQSKKGVEIQVPVKDNSIQSFEAWSSPIMHPDLGARYPQIQSYSARSLNESPLRARMGFTSKGFFAVGQGAEGLVIVEPLAIAQQRYYISYSLNDLPLSAQENSQQPRCGVTQSAFQEILEHAGHEHVERKVQTRSQGPSVRLRTYRLALASTGELSLFLGGSKAAVMEYFSILLNTTNLILQNDVAVKLELIPTNDTLIFLDPDTDGYPDGLDLGDIIRRNINVFEDNNVGEIDYDIGHTMISLRTPGTVGLAGGFACNNTIFAHKSAGATAGNFFSTIFRTATDIFAHEIGHQFTCGHSWNNCPANDNQRSITDSYEPGSGSTIMSYSGSCPPNVIQNRSDDYYNIGSVENFIDYSRSAGGSFCVGAAFVGNTEPDLSIIGPEDGFVIPISTPFELTAVAVDDEDDPLTYCWEQFDLGPRATLGSPVGNSPLFRSLPPTSSPTRVFPNILDLVANQSDETEVLPAYTRDLTFTCTVRDNHPEAGGTNWKEIAFSSTDQAGPFLVTSPNDGNETWAAGSLQTISWDVANTDQAPVNAKYVDVFLSVDGGFTYPYTLATGIPNTGSAEISVPDTLTTSARIKVKGHQTIWFDISNSSFSIVEGAPGYSYSVSSSNVGLCLPATYSFDISTAPVSGYDSLATLELVSPSAGIVFELSENPFRISDGASVTVSFEDGGEDEFVELDWLLRAPNVDSIQFSTFADLTSSDFSDVLLLSPADGTAGSVQAPFFEWTTSDNAQSYTFQLSNTPDFSNLIVEEEGLQTDSFKLPTVLDKGEIYYWRILSENECRVETSRLPNVFSTESQSCIVEQARDLPVSISSAGTPTVSSTLEVVADIIPDDINILSLRGNHDRISNIDARLEGPDGTEIALFTRLPCPLVEFDFNLDDDSNIDIDCENINRQRSFRPEEPISTFLDKNAKGFWRLELKVNDNFGNGGVFNGWGIQLCGDVTFAQPTLLLTDTIKVRKGLSAYVNEQNLQATDADTPDDNLGFVIIQTPEHGIITVGGNELQVGDRFFQRDLLNQSVIYTHVDTLEDNDDFYFIVDDGTAGTTAVSKLPIRTDEDAVVFTKEIDLIADQVLVFPNPTAGDVTIDFGSGLLKNTRLEVFDINGRRLQSADLAKGDRDYQLRLSFPAGMYVLRLSHAKSTASYRILLQP